MPYKVKELVFRVEIREPNHVALKLEENGKPGRDLGKEIVLDGCPGRTSGALVGAVFEEEDLTELLAALRKKLESAT